MKSYALLTLCAGALLAGCASNTAPVRTEPTYQEAASSQFLQSSAEAIGKLVAGMDMPAVSGGPVLVATILNDTGERNEWIHGRAQGAAPG